MGPAGRGRSAVSRGPLTVDPRTKRAQTMASAPDRSAWVAANAGSGKTFVLARRVVRLLVERDVDPSRILCLTFTKAAAANMANRVLGELGRFVAMSDADLAAALGDITGRTAFDPDLPTRARRAFARALESPGGLKIQTIHGFCEALLHQFPFEAGVAASFGVLAEDSAERLKAESWRVTLARAAADPASRLGQAATRFVLKVGETQAEDIVDALLARSETIAALIPDDQAWPAVRRRLVHVLGPGGDQDEAALDAAADPFRVVSPEMWSRIAGHLAAGSSRDREGARRIDEALATGDFDPVFLTSTGSARAVRPSRPRTASMPIPISCSACGTRRIGRPMCGCAVGRPPCARTRSRCSPSATRSPSA